MLDLIPSLFKEWRRGAESNRRIKVLQTSPLPLGYRARRSSMLQLVFWGAFRSLNTTQKWSGKRDSNPRLRPWQGRTLPLSYSRSIGAKRLVQPLPALGDY